MSGADFNIKRHDTRPALVRRLQETINGAIRALSLTDATQVKFLARKTATTGSVPVISGVCAVTDAVNGEVTYVWAGGDTATSGVYQAEFEITWADGGVETVPNDGYFLVTIEDDLG